MFENLISAEDAYLKSLKSALNRGKHVDLFSYA